MAKHLMNKGGYKNMLVHNRTKSKTDELVSMGAKFVDSPRELAQNVDYLFMMVGYPRDVERMIYCPDKGIKDHLKPGSYLIDHTTSEPSLAAQICETLKEKDVHSVDAPVTGGDIGARNGNLMTMVGGDKVAFENVKPLLDSYSSKIEHMGAAGNG